MIEPAPEASGRADWCSGFFFWSGVEEFKFPAKGSSGDATQGWRRFGSTQKEGLAARLSLSRVRALSTYWLETFTDIAQSVTVLLSSKVYWNQSWITRSHGADYWRYW